MITLIIFTILIIISYPANCISTIKVGDQLDDTSQLVSPGKIFTLGFFTIPETNNTYLGVWYTNDDRTKKVWVANPSKPINISSSGILMINPDTGILIITTGGTTLVNISDNESGHGQNLTATLEDTGNFQLKNKSDNRILWQSFDHPTNVLLPGMKLGSNLRAGKSWNLTSWLNDDIPDKGAFSLSWEAEGENSQRLMIRQRGLPYWTSGDLSNQTFKFMDVNSPTSEYWYNLSYIYNDEERSFSFHGINGVQGEHMWVLRPSGEIQEGGWLTVWTPEFCYGYDTGNGCVAGSKYNLPQCRSEKDRFRPLNGNFAPDINGYFDYNNIRITNSDCMLRCWDKCDCLGFVTINKGTGCGIWTGTKSLNNFSISPQGDGRLTYVLISPYPREGREVRQEEERQKRDDEYFLELMASESFKDASNLESNGRKGSELMVFSFASMVAATDNFSSENKLGQGGFGPVYKGKLSDEREIAIKRLSRASGQGLVEFKSELILIAKLQHTNLVRVLGCCIHGEEKMLVYEYMPNKSLDFFIFGKKTIKPKVYNNFSVGIYKLLSIVNAVEFKINAAEYE